MLSILLSLGLSLAPSLSPPIWETQFPTDSFRYLKPMDSPCPSHTLHVGFIRMLWWLHCTRMLGSLEHCDDCCIARECRVHQNVAIAVLHSPIFGLCLLPPSPSSPTSEPQFPTDSCPYLEPVDSPHPPTIFMSGLPECRNGYIEPCRHMFQVCRLDMSTSRYLEPWTTSTSFSSQYILTSYFQNWPCLLPWLWSYF